MAEQPQPQQPPESEQLTPVQRVALIVAALAVAGAAASAAAVPWKLGKAALSALTLLLSRWRYDRRTIAHTLRVAVRVSRAAGPGVGPTSGPASEANARNERVFTAWFLERTSERVQAAYAAGAATGDPEAREERFIEQHLDAQERRREAARRVDAEAAKPGQVTDRPPGADGVPGDPDGLLDGTRPRVILLWRAHPDDKVTPECLAADGAWFYADTPPVIGYPGMPHGGTCRCRPANAGSLAAVARGRHVNEAVRALVGADPQHRTHPGATLPPDQRSA